MSFDFYKRAAIVCRAIPYGKAATYGQIALLWGSECKRDFKRSRGI